MYGLTISARSVTVTSDIPGRTAATCSIERLGTANRWSIIQSIRGMAKPYQVRQVLKAIDKLFEELQ